MNILAMAIASTFNSQRKYLRWHLKPTAFFWGCLVLYKFFYKLYLVQDYIIRIDIIHNL